MKIKKLTLSNFMAFENLQLDWSDTVSYTHLRLERFIL